VIMVVIFIRREFGGAAHEMPMSLT
jgi:hypothetical protein